MKENGKGQPPYTIIVNGREKIFDEKKITYKGVVILAFGKFEDNPNIIYTVTYSKGQHPDKGTMVLGEEVKVKEGMIFNATRTDKS